jgi:hypothetical protein
MRPDGPLIEGCFYNVVYLSNQEDTDGEILNRCVLKIISGIEPGMILPRRKPRVRYYPIKKVDENLDYNIEGGNRG